MDLGTIETIITLLKDASTPEHLLVIKTIAASLCGQSALTVIGGIATGVGVAWAGLTTVCSEICARTDTRDTKLYKLIEFFGRQTEKAKQGVK